MPQILQVSAVVMATTMVASSVRGTSLTQKHRFHMAGARKGPVTGTVTSPIERRRPGSQPDRRGTTGVERHARTKKLRTMAVRRVRQGIERCDSPKKETIACLSPCLSSSKSNQGALNSLVRGNCEVLNEASPCLFAAPRSPSDCVLLCTISSKRPQTKIYPRGPAPFFFT